MYHLTEETKKLITPCVRDVKIIPYVFWCSQSLKPHVRFTLNARCQGFQGLVTSCGWWDPRWKEELLGLNEVITTSTSRASGLVNIQYMQVCFSCLFFFSPSLYFVLSCCIYHLLFIRNFATFSSSHRWDQCVFENDPCILLPGRTAVLRLRATQQPQTQASCWKNVWRSSQ